MLPAGLIDTLRALVGDEGLVTRPNELRVYECDGYTLEKRIPEVVVLPRTTPHVVEVVRLLFMRISVILDRCFPVSLLDVDSNIQELLVFVNNILFENE